VLWTTKESLLYIIFGEPNMNVEFVNPFLVSTTNVLSTMAKTTATFGKPFLKTDRSAKGDVTGIIGMSGSQAKGSLAITFTEAAILHIYNQMLGEVAKEVNDDVVDCVGEITNMITSGAKAMLSEKGYKFELAIPTMVAGKNHSISHKTKGSIICIPFDTVAGSFFIEVCFED
jgi:chemotaxis protein CheX